MNPESLNEAAARITAELDCWAGTGAHAELWLRDDDAVTATPALARLLELCRAHGVRPGVAVVPSGADDHLAAMLAARATACVHGIAHKNHARPGQKKQELHRDLARDETLARLEAALTCLQARFGADLLPVLVPPWNRIDAGLLPHLPALGFVGLSMFKARPARFAAPELVQVNTHVDLIDWRSRQGRSPTDVAAALVDALVQARTGSNEPVGILSHHLVHDEPAWAALEMVLRATCAHRAVRWCGANTLFSNVESL